MFEAHSNLTHNVPLDVRGQNGPLANSALAALIDHRQIRPSPLRYDQLMCQERVAYVSRDWEIA